MANQPDLPMLQPHALSTANAETIADRLRLMVLVSHSRLVIAGSGVQRVLMPLVTFRTSAIDIRLPLGLPSPM